MPCYGLSCAPSSEASSGGPGFIAVTDCCHYLRCHILAPGKKPFLTYITTFVTAIVTGLIVFTSSGGWEVLQASKHVHDGIHDGTLTEEDALKFMRTNMYFIEKTGVGEEDRQKLELMREMLNQMEGGVTEEGLQAINAKALAVIENENLSQEERQQFEELRKNLLQNKPELTSSATQQQPAGKKPAQA